LDRELRFIVSLKDNATRQARQLAHNLGSLNTTYRTSISLNLIDNVSRKLSAIYKKISDQRGYLALDMPAGLLDKARYFFDVLTSAFRSDESRKWYEKVFGYLKSLAKYASILGDTLVGGFLAAGVAIETVLVVATALLAKKMVAVNAEMEQYQVSLQTTLHSLTAAKEEMAKIVQFAKVTPYQIKDITAAVVKLSAYNMNIEEWLRPLGDMASAFGRDITDAVEAAADAMTGMFRRALSYGIKMERSDFDQGGKYAGMTYAEAFLKEVKRRFSGGMELQAQTFKGIWSNIQDTFYISFQQATAPAFERIKKLLSDFYESFNPDSEQFNPQLVGKIKDIFKTLSGILIQLVDSAEKFGKFFVKNILPTLIKIGQVGIELWGEFREIITTIIDNAVLPLLTVLAKLLEQFVDLVIWAKVLLKIWLGYRVVTTIFKILGIHVGSLATKMVAGNKAATLLSATLKTVATRVALLGAALATMWVVEKFISVRDSIKELAGALDDVAGGAENVGNYLENLGKKSGFNKEEMAKAAVAAKEYSNNMKNVLEIGSYAAGPGQEGWENLNMEAEKAVEIVGMVADAFIKEGEAVDVMKRKTQAAADLLVNLKRNQEELGITFENVVDNFERYSDVVAIFGDNVEGLEQIINEFATTAKLLGADADLGMLFSELQKILAPTKEMLLTMPADTWISRTTGDLKSLAEAIEDSDATAAAQYLANAELIENVMKEYGIVAGEAKKAQQAGQNAVNASADYWQEVSQLVEDRQKAGAQAQVDAATKQMEAAGAQERAAKAQEAANKSGVVTNQPGVAQNEGGIGLIDKLINFATDSYLNLGLTIAGIGTSMLVTLKLMNKGINKLGQVASQAIKVQTGAAGSRLARFGLNYAYEHATVPGMSAEEAAQGRTWLSKQLLKMEDRLIARTLPKDMLDRIEAATQRQVATLNNARNRALEDLDKQLLQAEKMKMPQRGARIDVINQKIRVLNKQFDDAVREIQKSHGALAKAVESGRVPTMMRNLADSIVDFTNGLEEASRTTSRAARDTARAARSLSRSGRGIMGGLFSIPLFGPGLKKISRGLFGNSGRLSQRAASVGAGTASVASSVSAVESGNVVKRLESQWIRKQWSKITGSLVGPFKHGIVAPGFQQGFFTPGAGEDYRPWVKKIVNLLSKNNGVLEKMSSEQLTAAIAQGEIKSISIDLAKQMSTQFDEAGRLFAQPSLVAEKATELSSTGTLINKFTGETKFLEASMDRLTGQLVLLDGHTSMMAAEMAGVKELPIKIDTGNWQELIKDVEGRVEGKRFPTASEVRVTPEGKLIANVTEKNTSALTKLTETFKTNVIDKLKAGISTRLGGLAGESGSINFGRLLSGLKEALPIATETASKAAAETVAKTATETASKVTADAATRAATEAAERTAARGTIAATETAAKAAAETASEAGAKVASRSATQAALKAVDPALWATMTYDMQKMIRQLPGWEEDFKEMGASMVDFEKKAGETEKEFYERMKGTVKTYDRINEIGVRTADFFETIGGSLRGVFSPVEGAIMSIYDAFTGKELFSSLAKRTKTAFVEGFEAAGSSLGDLIYGRGWQDKIAGATSQNLAYGDAFQQIYGISIADYQNGVDKIEDINEKAKQQQLLDARKLSTSVQIMHAKSLQDENSVYYKRMVLQQTLIDRAKAANDELVNSGKVSANVLKAEWQDQMAAIQKYVDEAVKPDTQLTDELVYAFERGGKAAGQAMANGIEEGIQSVDVDVSVEGIQKMTDELDSGEYSIEHVQAALKKMDDRLQHLEKTEIPLATKMVQKFAEELGELERQIKKNELELAALGQTMTNITSVFDLSMAINELALTSDSAQALNKEIARLNVELARQESELTPLENALRGIQDEYDAVKKSIDDAQESMDKFLNAPIEGEGAYQDQLFEIDKQIRALERQGIDLKQKLQPFEDAGLTDSDVYKQAAAAYEVNQAQIEALKTQRERLELDREIATQDIEHAREVAQRQDELTGSQITDGLAAAKAVIEANKPRLEQLETELEKQQALVDKKNKEIEATNAAIQAHERELTLLQKKVEYANQDAQAAREKLDAQQKIYDLQGAITDLGMVQVAQAMAQGQISSDAVAKLIEDYNKAAEKASDLTRTQTGLNYRAQQITFDKEAWDKILSEAQSEQSQLIDSINNLVSAAQSLITGLNPESSGVRDALVSVFGEDAKSKLQEIATATKKMAGMRLTASYDQYGNYLGEFDNGGIARAASTGSLAMLHNEEAVIPLQNGSVPVSLINGNSQGAAPTTIYSPTIEVGSIVVRNDEDLEELKEAILDLRQGQYNFFSRASQYPERF